MEFSSKKKKKKNRLFRFSISFGSYSFFLYFWTVREIPVSLYFYLFSFSAGFVTRLPRSKSARKMANSTYLLQVYSEQKRKEYIPVFIFYALIILFGLLGNSFAFRFYTSIAKKTVSSFFLAVLATNDLLTSIVLIDKIYQLYMVGRFTSSLGCKVLIFVNHVFVLNSGLIIISMNVDRCLHVCWPFSRWQFTTKSAKICVLLLLILSISVGSSNLFLTDSVEYEIKFDHNIRFSGHRCTHSHKEENQTAITIFHFVDLLTVIVTILSAIVIYSLIAWKIWKYKQRLKSIPSFKTSNTNITKAPYCKGNCIEASCTISQLDLKSSDEGHNHGNAAPETKNGLNGIHNQVQNSRTATAVNERAVHAEHSLTNSAYTRTSEARITAMMFTMTLGTVLCVVPYFYVSLSGHEDMSKDEYEMTAKTRLLRGSFAVYGALNPYVLGIFHREFRCFAQDFLKKVFLF